MDQIPLGNYRVSVLAQQIIEIWPDAHTVAFYRPKPTRYFLVLGEGYGKIPVPSDCPEGAWVYGWEYLEKKGLI